MGMCTYIDGIGSSQAIDTAGEIVDLKGLDCSFLIGGAYNWEHKSDVPAQLVGKVLDYKKIFSEEDCENDRHRKYWNKCKIPFLYVMGRLLDDKKESAKEVAALLLDDSQHPDEPPMVGFSIEGAKIEKQGMIITRSIARKVTITNQPANKTCFAEMVPAKKTSRNDPDSLFKGEIEFFNPNAQYLEFLEKREKDMQKDVGIGGGAFVGDSLSMSELQKAMPSWSHTGGGNFSHPEHGIVSVAKQPSGQFHVKHNGALAGLGGQKGVFNTAQEAGQHAGNYMRAIGQKKVLAPMSQNHSSPSMLGKALEVGSSLSAPSQLTQGAALGKEEIEKCALANPTKSQGWVKREVRRSKEKSKWLKRAEEAYATWEKREEFRSFMNKSMPHLTKGEIDAFGQVLALKKSIAAEGTLEKMYASYFGKTTDILMAKEKKE